MLNLKFHRRQQLRALAVAHRNETAAARVLPSTGYIFIHGTPNYTPWRILRPARPPVLAGFLFANILESHALLIKRQDDLSSRAVSLFYERDVG